MNRTYVVTVVRVFGFFLKSLLDYEIDRVREMAEMEDHLTAYLEAELPLRMEALVLPSENKRVGLVIVDEVKCFCTVGAGNLVGF